VIADPLFQLVELCLAELPLGVFDEETGVWTEEPLRRFRRFSVLNDLT
jgi:hypothetical protein